MTASSPTCPRSPWFEMGFLLTPAVSVARSRRALDAGALACMIGTGCLGGIRIRSACHGIRRRCGFTADGLPSARSSGVASMTSACCGHQPRWKVQPGRTSDQASAERGRHARAVNAFLLGFRRCSPSSTRSAAPSSFAPSPRDRWLRSANTVPAGGDLLAVGDDGGAVGRFVLAFFISLAALRRGGRSSH